MERVKEVSLDGEPQPRLIIPSQANAIELMYQHRDGNPTISDTSGGRSLPFDVVDLDPYGSASPFLDNAVQAVADGGLLCVTCTDMAVLAGNHMDACRGKYGAMPLRAKHYHEQALRILLGTVDTAAARHHRYITPLMSLSMDFYIRVFVQVTSSAKECNAAPTRLAHLLQCTGCDAFWLWPLGKWPNSTHHEKSKAYARKERGERVAAVDGAPAEPSSAERAFSTVFHSGREAAAAAAAARGKGGLHVHANFAPPPMSSCPHCDRPVHMGGPIWLDPIHDQAFVAVRAHP